MTDAAAHLEAVSDELYSLNTLLEEYRHKPGLPEQTRIHFLEAIQLIIDTVAEFHKDRNAFCNKRYSKNEQKREKQLIFYSNICVRTLTDLHSLLFPHLEASMRHANSKIYPSIIRGVRVFEEDVHLTLISGFEYNFGIEVYFDLVTSFITPFIGSMDESKVNEILEKVKKFKKWHAFVSYPIGAKESALNLTIIAHELGHLVDFTEPITEGFLPIKLDEKSFKDYVKVFADSSKSGIDDDDLDTQMLFSFFATEEERRAAAYAACLKISTDWLYELVADVLAVHALGPAYLYSFEQFLASSGLPNEPDPEHDAPAQRMIIVLNELEYLGYFKKSTSLRTHLEEVRKRATLEVPSIEYTPKFRVAHETVASNEERILKELRRVMGPHSYDADKHASEVGPIVETILRGLAPIEVYNTSGGEPKMNSVMGILNAGWEVRFSKRSTFIELFYENIPISVIMWNLNQLLFKGIEASEVARIWKKEKS